MPKWNDFGNIWSTLREIDVNAIRDESERPLRIVATGHAAALEAVDRLLHSGAERYGPDGPNPLTLVPLDQAHGSNAFGGADLLLFAVDTRVALTPAEAEAFSRLEQLSLPFLLVLAYGEQPSGAALPPVVRAHTLALPSPQALSAADQLAAELLERLPSELHLSAARRLPGLRTTLARELINGTSFTNATYAAASGLPGQIPIVSVPFAAADILVLTKNQAMLVYRLALAYGAPPDFQARIREVIPVVGGAFLWRQAARSLVGLIPVWGLLPKVAVAYAGTYTTGVAAWRWYASGELVSTAQLRRISGEALELGRARASELIARARALRPPQQSSWLSQLIDRAKRLLPRRKPREISSDK